MVFVVAAVLVAVGFAAWSHRWLWSLVAAFALLAAWEPWASGAYSDSGNALGYSLMIMAMVLAPTLVGALVGWAVDPRRRTRDRFGPDDAN